MTSNPSPSPSPSPSSSPSPMRVIVCGGGIAGLAVASALRAPGREIVVLERSSKLGEIGAAIQLKPNATRFMDLLGLDRSKLRGVEVTRVLQLTHDGGPMLENPVNARVMFGDPWLLTHRADLHFDLLRAATWQDSAAERGPPAEVLTSVKVTSVDVEQGVVRSEDGRTWKGDLIVGADGIRSVVRDAILGNVHSQASTMPAEQAAYRFLIPTSRLVHDPDLCFLTDKSKAGMVVWVGQDRRLVTYPCRDLEYINVVAIFPDFDPTNQPGPCPDGARHWGRSWSQPSTPEAVLEDYKTFAPYVRRFLSYAQDVTVWQLRDVDALQTWTKGKAVIVGDAAHAMLPHMGQGGSTSLEDAAALHYVFNDKLDNEPTSDQSISAKLSAFQHLRLERIHNIQHYSRVQGMPKYDEATGQRMSALQFSKFAFGWAGFGPRPTGVVYKDNGVESSPSQQQQQQQRGRSAKVAAA